VSAHTAVRFGPGCHRVLLPGLVPAEQPEAANGRLFAVQTVGRDVLGHVLGGVLFVIGRAIPLLLDALSFLPLAALLVGVRGPRPDRSTAGPRLWSDIREDLAHVLRDPLLRFLTVSAGVLNAVYPGQLAIFVVLARDGLGLPDAAYGVLLAVGAVGGVAGSMAASRVTRAMGRVPARGRAAADRVRELAVRTGALHA